MNALHLHDLVFEPLKESDFGLLHTWLNSPHVAGTWGRAPSLEAVHARYLGKIASAQQQAFVVSKDGEPFGFMQWYRARGAGDAWWPHESDLTVGIDQFIGATRFLGKGLGSAMARELSDWLLRQPGNQKVIADPDPTNARAIACYRRAGFRDVEFCVTPDGPALLMEKTRG